MFDLFIEKTTKIADKLVSLIILIVTLRLVLYMITSLYKVIAEMANGELWISDHNEELLDWIVFYIVMIKAYKILVSYARHHHVSIRYVTELVIIACFVEFIFERQMSDVFRALLGTVGLGSLFLYLNYYSIFKDYDGNKK